MSGTIQNLSRLTSLQRLSLHTNQLSGRLPTSLGNLTSLAELYLGSNNLDGPIPDLSNLTGLMVLDLSGNQVSGEIPDLSALTSLTTLNLSGNNLDGEIPDLSALINLTVLNLSGNQVIGTIPNLSSLTGLTQLALNNNQLRWTIPATLNSLTGLTQLTLNNNQLSGTIPKLSNLTGLTQLTLNNNQLSGTIPATLNSLTVLTQLALNNNQLSGTIPDLSALTSLATLNLANNQLTGTIPDSLDSLTSLQFLHLSGNQLSGEIPAELGTLTNLQVTRFASNTDADGNPSLSGCVPFGLRNLVAAEEVSMGVPAHDFIPVDANSDGDFDDPDDVPGLGLPFCLLSALAFSDVTLAFAAGTATYTAVVVNTVESTTVTATLEDSNDSLSIRKGSSSYASGAAVPLAVGQNEITITVTPTDGTPPRTYTVAILRGAVDRETLMALYNSTGGTGWTDKTHWGSTEPITEWYGVDADSDDNVTALELPGNDLRGTLPASLGALTSLTTLDLSGNNQVTGAIPDLRALTSLATLNLGDNQLSGTIPDLSALTSLTTLNLRDNQLTGAIPEELGNLTELDVLYLDDNQLSGPIPAALGGLSGLQATRFAGNALTGCVPNGLRRLVEAEEVSMGVPAHDFIAVGGTPGLGLPFCTLESLILAGVTLEPPFASDTVVYAGSAAPIERDTLVLATLHDGSDVLSIMKGADTYMNGGSVPLEVGQNVLTFEITPEDGTPTHTYTVTVTRAPNTPPTFADGQITMRGVVENTAAGVFIGAPMEATDADFDTLTYSLDATSAASFSLYYPGADPDSGRQLRTEVALDHETKSSYTVTVSVSDSMDANSDADEVTDDTFTMTILVANVNEAPEFPTSETGMRGVGENTPSGLNIGRPVAATDPENDTLTYSLGGTDRATFDIVATTGQLKTKAALDFESTNSYSVAVTAVDPSGEEDTIDVTITVIDAEEAGTVTLSSTQPIVDTSLTATLGDPDVVSGSETWSWASSPDGASSWTPISGETSDTYTPVAADMGNYLRATASYTDGLGSGKSAQAVSANRVQPAPTATNQRPEFASIDPDLHNVNENTRAGGPIGPPVMATDADNDPLTYSLGGPDAASFDIDSTTGQLRTKAALDYETTATYDVTVTATDTSGVDVTYSVTINVNNLDEPATVTLSSPQPLVTIEFTATLDEPDEVRGSVTWSWASSPNGASAWTSIREATRAIYRPVADDLGDYLRATASYTDGHGAGKSALAISANAVEGPPGRNTPVLREYPTATRSFGSNTPAGSNVGAPFTATDPDNDALTYSLGGPDAASFDIVSTTGQLLTNTLLTGIRRTGYVVFVSISDGKDDRGDLEPTPQIDATTRVTITLDASSKATGRPAITGKAEVGEELTANTSGIMDADGLSTPSYAYQWVRVPSGGVETDITGATSAAYTVTQGDLGVALKVKTTFTDDKRNPESAESALTAVVTVTQVVVSFGPGPYGAAEGGPAATVQVSLDKDPHRTVTILLTATPDGGADSADYIVPIEVVFNAGETTKDVTVTAVDDSVEDDGESVALTFGMLPNGVSEGTTAQVVVQITDNDGKGIVLSPTSLTVPEGGSATYTVALASQPTAPVTVTITGHSGTDVGLNHMTLSFTTSDWNTEQSVIASADQDNDSDNDSVTLTHTASAADYAGVEAALAVTVTDDDEKATGAPVISGPPEVGEELAADTSGIMDADGLTSVSYAYQWVRVASGGHGDRHH